MKTLRIGESGVKDFSLLRNVEDVRMYVDMYSTSFSKNTPVIGDLSLLSKEAVSVLLKFIEDEVEDIICYASQDNISPVLMSRFELIEKKEKFKVGHGDFINFIDELEQRERVDSVPRLFLSVSGGALDKYLMYRNLSKGALTRIVTIL